MNDKKSIGARFGTSEDLTEALRLYRRRLGAVVDLAADFYWETDIRHYLTYYWSRDAGESDSKHDPLQLLGKNQRQLGEIPSGDESEWEQHLAVRETRKPFSGFLHKYFHPDAGLRYVRLSGGPIYDSRGELSGYCGVARDVTEEVENQRLLRLETDVLRYISGKESIGEAIRGAMEMICREQGWEAGSFWQLDGEAGVLRYKTGWASKENDAVARKMKNAYSMTFACGEGLPGWVWETREMLWVPDIHKDERISTTEVTDLTGWNAAFLFPVTFENRFLGVLDFCAPEISEPSERLLRVVHLLGTKIGHYYQRALTLEELRKSESRFRSLTELSSDWYWEQDSELRFTRFEGQESPVLAAMRRDLVGKRVWESGIEYLDQENSGGDPLKPVMEKHASFRDVIRHRKFSNGAESYISVSGEPVYDDNGKFQGYRGIARDVTEAKLAEKKIQYMATHDPLTGLPNRMLFSQLLNYSIETAHRYGRKFAVLFLDLDGFKHINDTLGHHAGDRFLVEISERIKNTLRESDVIGRMGGDEFVILVQEISERARIVTVAANILSAVDKPVVMQKRECRATVSIGITIYPDDAEDEDSILKNADTAMYLAKQGGKNNYRFYDRS